MKIKKVTLWPVFILLFLISVNGYSQTIGKIYSKTEANNLFGTVIESVQMNVDQFKNIILQTNTYVMVKVLNGELTVLGDGRNVLYPAGGSVGLSEVFYLSSKSKIIELLNSGSENIISIERRLNNTTITLGLFTLEEMWPCPPVCE